VSEQPKDEPTGELLRSIGDELREIKNIQQVMVRNFNAVVVMIIFAVLMYLVGIFFGQTIARNVDSWLTGTSAGRTVEQTVKQIGK
jgi:hypothetical protein